MDPTTSPDDLDAPLAVEPLPAPQTTAPVRCPHFGPCGGCTSLDLPYELEARAKGEKVATTLGRHPELAKVPVLSILAAAEPLLYRTAVKVPFGWSRQGPVAGFFERRTHSIVDLTTCLIQHPKLTQLVLAAKEIVSELKIAIHDERTGRGILRHLVARVGEGTGEVLAGLVVQAQGYGKIRGLAMKLLERLGGENGIGLVGVVQNIHDGDEDHAVLGEHTLPLAGRTYLEENSDGLRFRTSLSSFVQVNASQARALYGTVLHLLDEQAQSQDLPDLKGQRIADLYCGVGPISLRLARAGALVDGVEHSEDAVRSARWAAKTNGLAERAHFHAGDAAQTLVRLARTNGEITAATPLDAIVVDPPRRGLSPATIAAIEQSGAKKVVYVSCDPITFARDLALLSKTFEVAAVRPVDMFPRTPHVEAVALLRARAAAAPSE